MSNILTIKKEIAESHGESLIQIRKFLIKQLVMKS
jgi:hypothetical protein